MEIYFYITIVSSIGAALLLFNKKRKEELVRTRLIEEETRLARMGSVNSIIPFEATIRSTFSCPSVDGMYTYNEGYFPDQIPRSMKQRYRYYIQARQVQTFYGQSMSGSLSVRPNR